MSTYKRNAWHVVFAFAFALGGAQAQVPVFQTFPGQESAPNIGMQLANQTIRPFLTPEFPSPIPNQLLAIDILGNGRPDVLACHLSLPPYPKGRFPCRVFRPQVDGSIVEVTTQVFGGGRG